MEIDKIVCAVYACGFFHTSIHTHTSKPHLVNIKMNTSHLNNKKDKDRLDLLFHLIKLH